MERYCSGKKPVIIRQVWAWNLREEIALIQHVLPYYRFASMDTEFPGVIFRPGTEKHQYPHLSPTFNYRLMKANVDALNLIQLGLTLSDPYGNLPDFGTPFSHIWEFNFSDFNLDSDSQNPESITLLKNQGIDFDRNRQEGIASQVFASILVRAGLVSNSQFSVTWVTFHGSYDFGFLIKILTQNYLPPNLPMFMRLVQVYFGGSVLDMKHVIKYCDGLYGGLERVAKALDVDRVAGKSHQAGSDSLLTLETFLKLRDLYFNGDGGAELDQFDLVLHGLEPELKKV
ncbi:probable CCR4-associated factor 1 homolog 11 [Actinidia eriantha]|uniref:probable CCR4-associated factor 1 homolog 11 n=1 Tax=Actinidia eriantha TaxID=165200 RepID=UPI002587D270|nr:probable CCR4-associated factor 1 homolog 11 [Actinidia eriantha]